MKKRSKLRLIWWKIYFSTRKYIYWYFSNKRFSKKIDYNILKYEVFSHKSLINRKLSWVDEQLQLNKFINLWLAIKHINWLIIKPWEKFSYWKLIWNPTKNKWYKKWVVLSHWKFIEWYWWWICQLSNLLYWMFLHTKLTITERFRHSYDVFPDYKRKVPFWTWATCYYPFLDLEIMNNTDNDYQIMLFIKWNYLYWKILSDTKNIFSYKIIERDHKILHLHMWTYIRHNQIFREKFNLNWKKISEEFIVENNAFMMYNPIIAYKKKYLIEDKVK
jgi:vancomycin resistance protein VanW